MSRPKSPVLCGRPVWDGKLVNPDPEVTELGDYDPCALTRGHWDRACRTQRMIDEDNANRRNRVDNRAKSTRRKSEPVQSEH